LRDAEKRNAVAAIALKEALEEGKRKLADRAGNLEERENHGTVAESLTERELFSVERS
jgi:hypothetical protein